MRIAIDIDGVLCDWNLPFAGLLTTLTGKVVDTTGSDFPAVWDWPQAMGFTQTEVDQAWQFISENPDWWFYLPPTPDMTQLLVSGQFYRLLDEHEVYAVTNRKKAKQQSEAWILHNAGMYCPVITIEGSKGQLYRAMSLDLAIDDKPEHLTDTLVGESDRPERLVLIDQPYNRHVDNPVIERKTLLELVSELVPAPQGHVILEHQL